MERSAFLLKDKSNRGLYTIGYNSVQNVLFHPMKSTLSAIGTSYLLQGLLKRLANHEHLLAEQTYSRQEQGWQYLRCVSIVKYPDEIKWK